MAAVATADSIHDASNGMKHRANGSEDPFTESDSTFQQPYSHRFSSRFELDGAELGAASSPAQVKRVLEAHLLETERRLQDTHKLGTSLLQQQEELQEKLQEVEQQQDEAEISPELKQRLASIGREHDDVSREIARSLLAPKSRAVSGEDKSLGDSTTLTSQATGSPTKISAPNRRSRNQPVNRAGDLQFAADISTSLLAQVRQLQTAVAERDEALKLANAERSKMEQDVQVFSQRLRSHDDNEQKYKDENWNLQAQNHELLSAQRETADKEKRLNAAMAVANVEKTRLLNEIEESRLAHSKVLEEHEASKKSHETEILGLKRDFDAADSERSILHNRIDELTNQNQELAEAMATRLRNQSPQRQPQFGIEDDDVSKDLSTPEHSPPPSPTKATPRHGGLESETLKSSLHHAHRMIQNLKSNIHREKTEKIELKRMLQDARDELEQRRNDTSLGNGAKKQRAKGDVFKKPARPDMLGGSRRQRTDVEVQDDDWEDNAIDGPSYSASGRLRPIPPPTDLSDAYQTAHETESNFETADEQQTTESEAFETGAESLAGDSSDDLTETESTAPRSLHRVPVQRNRPSLGFRPAGTRDSYLSTASTSAGEEDDQMQTPVQAQQRFKVRNGRSSVNRQTQLWEGTPDSARSQATSVDSPATVTDGRSPPGVEQSLFAELEGINDNSSSFSTPARSGVHSIDSTPGVDDTPSKPVIAATPVESIAKAVMVDSATMTDPWRPDSAYVQNAFLPIPESFELTPAGEKRLTTDSRAISIGDFPLPPSEPPSTYQGVDMGTQYTPKKIEQDVATTTSPTFDPATQYTPLRALPDSPSRNGTTFITPPKTVWDTEHESEMGSPEREIFNGETRKPALTFSGMFSQQTAPKSPADLVVGNPAVLAYSTIHSQQTYPIAPPPSQPPTGPLPAIPGSAKKERSNTDTVAASLATGGILAGAAAALGLSWSKDKDNSPKIAEDETSAPVQTSTKNSGTSLLDISGNAVLRNKKPTVDDELKQGTPVTTLITHQDLRMKPSTEEVGDGDRSLKSVHLSTTVPISSSASTSENKPLIVSKSPARSPEISGNAFASGRTTPTSPPLRPASSSSNRTSTTNKQHPPLPSDYKTNIARANSLVQNVPLKRENSVQAVGTVMGPPIMPASAMRRPKTPADSTRSPTRDNATPRTSTRPRNNTDSQVSRRSSISSFASEIDHRFGNRAGHGNGYEPAPGTDPRMIQAITQTMIGEYLWKYTRKAGGKEMSTTRHRRYFWVHPYAKTLYWSTTDPTVPGAKESTSRSVQIESVRVVSDDNPMPPGLHRKSLEITTPSRKLKFTASTGQRHETWFNALSYLLLRETPDNNTAYATVADEITKDDVDEFRVSSYDPHLVSNSRQSMSSYNSRTTTGTTKRASGAVNTNPRQAMPSNVVSTNNGSLWRQDPITRPSGMPPPPVSGRSSRADRPMDADKDRTIRASSVSRVSRMLGSITGRSSRQAVHEEGEVQTSRGPSRQSNSIYDASVVSPTRDSAEETRQEMLDQEAAGLGTQRGLENVRACCDGKHDVSTLTHSTSHRTGERHGALSSMSDRINRSMSKRL